MIDDSPGVLKLFVCVDTGASLFLHEVTFNWLKSVLSSGKKRLMDDSRLLE